jgi:carbonic anhydrase
VVLGHEGCGAVKAAIEYKLKGKQHHSRIQTLVNSIVPGLSAIDPHLSGQEQLARAVEANVRWSMNQLLDTPEGKRAARQGRKKLAGAVFEINSGRVRFLNESS